MTERMAGTAMVFLAAIALGWLVGLAGVTL